MFPASRQDIEVLKDRFVVFCQLMSSCGRKRWSNEVTCKEWVRVKLTASSAALGNVSLTH